MLNVFRLIRQKETNKDLNPQSSKIYDNKVDNMSGEQIGVLDKDLYRIHGEKSPFFSPEDYNNYINNDVFRKLVKDVFYNEAKPLLQSSNLTNFQVHGIVSDALNNFKSELNNLNEDSDKFSAKTDDSLYDGIITNLLHLTKIVNREIVVLNNHITTDFKDLKDDYIKSMDVVGKFFKSLPQSLTPVDLEME